MAQDGEAFQLNRGRPMTIAAVGAVVILVAAAAATTPGFISIQNFRAILAATTFVGLIAVGMTVIMISGSFVSMSLGTMATITAIFFIYALKFGIAGAILSTLLLGGVLGLVQGFLIGAWDANPIIVTIAAGALMEGVSVALTGGQALSPPDNNYAFLNTTPCGIPVGTFVLLLLVAVVEFLLRRTRLGREVYMLGESRAAARAASLSLGEVGCWVFMLAGFSAALAGIFLASFNHGASLLLNRGTLNYDAIAATLIGGTAIVGGRGSVWRTLLGVILIATITNLVLLRGYSFGAQIFFKGVIMAVFVIVIHLRSQRGR
ncbi:MAG: ABC transporter permease [Parvibaculaceae bacterium]|nr:ABC transporter permease [Parvibaculaceae bacterium]